MNKKIEMFKRGIELAEKFNQIDKSENLYKWAQQAIAGNFGVFGMWSCNRYNWKKLNLQFVGLKLTTLGFWNKPVKDTFTKINKVEFTFVNPITNDKYIKSIIFYGGEWVSYFGDEYICNFSPENRKEAVNFYEFLKTFHSEDFEKINAIGKLKINSLIRDNVIAY